MKKLITLLCIAAAFTFSARAQTVSSNPGNDEGRDTSAVNFSNQARMAGLKEIKASQLAISKSKNQQIVSFASMMVTDHQKANMELIRILKSKKYNVPPYNSGLGVTVDPLLTSTMGGGFDKIYVTMMLNDHKQAISLFTYAANNQLDPDLKAFAQKTLPTLKQHLSAIQAIATQMGLNP